VADRRSASSRRPRRKRWPSLRRLSGRKVHILRLSDGKDVTYSPPGRGSVDAQIETSGLYYSYNYQSGHARGRVAFMPFAAVLEKLG